MALPRGLFAPGVLAALASAALFGAGTPLAKQVLGGTSPWLLAGLLYLGSGLGLTLFRWLRKAPPVHLPAQDLRWFAAAVLAGGVLAPVLLMVGLSGLAASEASLLLTSESVFTAVLAWVFFGESAGRRLQLGLLCLVAGVLVLGWPGGTAGFSGGWPAASVLAACLLWGLDNNLMRRVALAEATWLAGVKGLVAGSVNLLLAGAVWGISGQAAGAGALTGGSGLPGWSAILGALAIGALAYGASLSLFVLALRHLGTARTGAYFSLAPFVGAALGLALGDPLTPGLLAAGVLMALGLWLHLSEHHEHPHSHPAMAHDHEHTHDAHHRHHGPDSAMPAGAHRHWHRHDALTHEHPHFPDEHHRHSH